MCALAACGGSGGGGGEKSKQAASPTARIGTDDAFVADVCSAYRRFRDELNAALKDTSGIKTADDLTKRVAQPLTKLSTSFANVRVPKDLTEWHTQASAELTRLASRIAEGRLDAAAELGQNPIPPPPEAAIARLQPLTAANSDCKASGFDFAAD